MNICTLMVLGVVVAGSAGAASAGPDRYLGASVRANVDAQVVDHDPDYSAKPAAGFNGRRAADAMIRYQTGQLKPLFKTNGRTDVGTQGGASDAPTVSIPLISTGSPN